MSLSSTYLSRKELIADNLQSMGVSSADADDGLTTLANKILDIEPSISGLDLDTSLILHSSDDECLVGQSIMFWAELKADYDDETATDVDLSGVLTGATVTFKNGNTVLGTGVTDANGIAYYTHTFATAGTYNITASFAGTENFDDCVSSSITVSVTYEITITADKPILSFADSDIANITATLTDGVAGVGGETLSYEVLDKEDNVLDSGSDVTDSLGDISFTYQSAGVGDVQVIVYYGMFLQETFVVEDCNFYDPMTSNIRRNHYSKSVSSATANIDEYNSNGWKYGYGSAYFLFVCDYVPTFPYGVSFEITDKGSSYDNGIWIANGSLVNFMNGNNKIQIRTSSYSTYNVSVIGKWTVKVYSNKFEVYRDDVYIGERTHSSPTPSIELECGGQTTRYIQIKDLKIKPL